MIITCLPVQVKATMIDERPLRGESVRIVAKITSTKVFRKQFTVLENGIVDFVVPSKFISQKAKSLALEVSSHLLVYMLQVKFDL